MTCTSPLTNVACRVADLVQPKTMETVARKYLTTLYEREVKNKENEDRGEGCNMVWRAASIARCVHCIGDMRLRNSILRE